MSKPHHLTLIVSAGRTGTKYFGDLLGSMIPGAFSVHEPDVIAPGYPNLQRIRALGLYQTVIGKAMGRTGMRNLSERLIAQRLSVTQVAREIRRSRDTYYQSIDADPIIESHPGWYGVLPALPEAFPHYRVVVMTRDPRTWVTSVMRWGSPYGPRDRVAQLDLRRLNPALTGEQDLAARWRSLPRFEKVCWTWRAINERLYRAAQNDRNLLPVRYEDVFLADHRYDTLDALLKFVCEFSDHRFSYRVNSGILDRRVHQSSNQGFPAWTNWDAPAARTLDAYCGELMRCLGYGGEAAWQAKLA